MSSSYSSPNGEIVVSSLVPQEAIDAVMRQYRLLHPCPDVDPCTGCAVDLTDILEAAARHIRADTLRWAASRVRKEHAAKYPWPNPFTPAPIATPTQLEQWANELEAGDN